MKLFRNVFGRSQPPAANLDNLFAVPSAAVTLEVATGFKPTGVASVCYRQAEGGAFATTQADVQELLDADAGPKVERTTDEFGFTWLVVRGDPSALTDLVTDVHAVNSALENNGFGPSLLCSLVTFADDSGRKFALVYLYKQGTFYPFAPVSKVARDNLLEIQVRDQLAGELPMERDLSRWLALWGAPGL